MSGAWLEPDLATVCLLGIGSAILGLLSLLCCSASRRRHGMTVEMAFSPALGAGAAAATALGEPATVWVPLLVLGCICGILQLTRFAPVARACTRAFGLARNPWLQSSSLLVAGPLFALAWAHWTEYRLDLREVGLSSRPVQSQPNAPRPVPARLAATDTGRSVQLFSCSPEPCPTPATLKWEAEVIRCQGLTCRIIRTAPPGSGANCHGWTFAAGHYLVDGADVENILEDNDYHAVAVPEADDLVLYRDAQGRIDHSGIVRVAGADGLILVESKWGCLGTYVHGPADHPFGTSMSYFRSPRSSHRLRGIEEESSFTPTDLLLD